LPPPHRVVFAEVASKNPPDILRKIIDKVIDFKDFAPENDPYDEHDFGTITVEGKKFMWKIDYYDQDLEGYEEDGIRVFTIMEPSEW
jgi:hypothetical protein